MSRLFLLFNHTITGLQEKDARAGLGVEEIVSPPPVVRDIWRQIPADAGEIDSCLAPVKDWLASQAAVGDYVLIQGDFGACFIMAKYSLKKGLVPLYSTTSRDAVEKHLADGTVELVHAFHHVCFRRYGQ